jgi:bifunctional non-homologous end joining protein LigD
MDGEVIVQDERGVSDFEALKSALRWTPQRLVFCAFDLLHLKTARISASDRCWSEGIA